MAPTRRSTSWTKLASAMSTSTCPASSERSSCGTLVSIPTRASPFRRQARRPDCCQRYARPRPPPPRLLPPSPLACPRYARPRRASLLSFGVDRGLQGRLACTAAAAQTGGAGTLRRRRGEQEPVPAQEETTEAQRDRHGKRLGHPLAAFDVRSPHKLQVPVLTVVARTSRRRPPASRVLHHQPLSPRPALASSIRLPVLP